MSVLDIGQSCTLCHLKDFLPLACPHCHSVYCKDHILSSSHSCPDADRPPEPRPLGSLGYLEKCHFGPCVKPSIESVAGVEGKGKQGDIAREVRCPQCAGAFCVEHRHQDAHKCSGPRTYNARQDAAEERKKRAAEVLAKHFPDQHRRVIPKPESHTRDLKHVRPAPESKIPPSVQAERDAASSQPPSASAATVNEGGKVPPVKTKAFKLHEISVRKIKMGAKPLTAGLSSTAADNKVFFEVSMKAAGMASVEEYMSKGTTAGVVRDKVWVPSTMPVGKLLDTLVAKAGVKAGVEGQSPKLLALSSPPDAPRDADELGDLSKPVSVISDGSLVLLVL